MIVISDPAECLAEQTWVLLTVRHPDPRHQESLRRGGNRDNKKTPKRLEGQRSSLVNLFDKERKWQEGQMIWALEEARV